MNKLTANNHIKLLKGITLILFLLINSALQAQDKMIKVACIGNSVTYGYGLTDREHNSYPSQLQQLLGGQYMVKNFGHSGATLLKKGHNPYYKTNEFMDAIAFNPDIAIIHLGLNDTDPRDWPNYKESFEADYAWLIAAFKKSNPAVQIWICRLTPIFNGHPRFKSGTRDWYWQIQQLIPVIAQANQTKLIDLHTPLYDRPHLFADNLHPDKEGAGIIAKTIYQAITKNFGGLKPDKVFADHMVLQRRQPIPVYGVANAGDLISVTFQRRTITATTDSYGHWKVNFPATQAGGPFEMKINCKNDVVILKDILIGDVWLCSGQSNMAFPLVGAYGGRQELAHIKANTQLRLCQYKVLKETDAIAWDTTVLKKVNQLQYFSGTWQTPDSLSMAGFSAVAYYFGKKISTEEHVPIGLIQVAVGGSPIESWIDRYTMEHDPILVDVLTNWRTSDFVMDFCRTRADINLKNATLPKQRHPYEPCYNFEAGISSLTNFPIKGVIWYQGESNAHNLELYNKAFPVLVNSWREKWGIKNLSFYYVQLSAIDRPSWPAFRNMQRQLQKQVPDTHMAVSMDVGDSLNVHYTRKEPVGERLALLALHYTYKKSIVAEAADPLYARKQGNYVIVTFPLTTKLIAAGNKVLQGFELVNVKGERFVAEALIKGNTVRLTIPASEDVKEIFYAMQPFTRANLFNSSGLPVSTFILSLNRTKDKFLLN